MSEDYADVFGDIPEGPINPFLDCGHLFDPVKQAHAIVGRATQEFVKRKGVELCEQYDGDASTWAPVDMADAILDAEEVTPSVLARADGRHLMAPGITVLFGKSATGKSWLAYEAARQELEAGSHVVVIDHEMSARDVARRLQVLGATREDLASGRLHYVHPMTPFGPASLEALRASLGDATPSLVVVDSTNESLAMHGLDPISTGDVARWANIFVRPLATLWPEAAIVLIDHLPKTADDTAEEPYGAQGKKAMADALILVCLDEGARISRDSSGRGRLVCRKDRRGWFDPGAVMADYQFGGGQRLSLVAPNDVLPGAVTPRYSSERPGRDAIADMVMRFLESSPSPVGITPIRDACPRAIRSDVDSVVRDLVADGRLKSNKHGNRHTYEAL